MFLRKPFVGFDLASEAFRFEYHFENLSLALTLRRYWRVDRVFHCTQSEQSFRSAHAQTHSHRTNPGRAWRPECARARALSRLSSPSLEGGKPSRGTAELVTFRSGEMRADVASDFSSVAHNRGTRRDYT